MDYTIQVVSRYTTGNNFDNHLLLNDNVVKLDNLNYEQQSRVLASLIQATLSIQNQLEAIYNSKEFTSSSTGKEPKTVKNFYIYTNKCKYPYGGGMVTVVASNAIEAHAIFLLNVEEFIIDRYEFNGWDRGINIGFIRKPTFIAEKSHIE